MYYQKKSFQLIYLPATRIKINDMISDIFYCNITNKNYASSDEIIASYKKYYHLVAVLFIINLGICSFYYIVVAPVRIVEFNTTHDSA